MCMYVTRGELAWDMKWKVIVDKTLESVFTEAGLTVSRCRR